MSQFDSISLNSYGSPINVTVRCSARAKNISIRIFRGKPELVIPSFRSLKKAHKFLLYRENWIRAKLAKHQDIDVSTSHIPIYGMLHEISVCPKNILRIENGKVFIPKNSSPIVLITLFKSIARNDFVMCASALSKRLGVTYNKIHVKDTKSRWGSCSSNSNLSFSWRIIFAPKFVMEYLVAHELSHIIEKNHGREFWELVKSLHPDYIASRNWLKQNGYSLHKYMLPVNEEI